MQQNQSVRRYWQKVRAKVKPPAEDKSRSRRYKEIDRKESRQVTHLLHLLTSDFVSRMWESGVSVIVIGNLSHIRQRIDYGKRINQRLHAWPFAKIAFLITYKALLCGMTVVRIDESYSSQTCHACGMVKKSNRKTRGLYSCLCGWTIQSDANGCLNHYERYTNVSPMRSSGSVAEPVVMPLRLDWHTVYEPQHFAVAK